MVVCRGVAQVQRYRIVAVRALNVVEPLGGFIHGFIPADRHPAIGGALHRVAQAVWVVMQILQRHGLRADMPTAERVGLVTTDSVYVISVVLYLDTAHGFA